MKKVSLPLRVAIQLADALTEFEATPQNVPNQPVKSPFKLGGHVRMKMARSLLGVTPAVKSYHSARMALVLDLTEEGKAAVAPEKMGQLNQELEKLLSEAVEVTIQQVSEADLRLDENAIPVSTLASLGPMIEGWTD